MDILLVNDDGIDSSRLVFTEKILSQYGDVTVVAPKVQHSGKSVAISIGGFGYEKLDESHYAIEGTPADCITFAIYGLNYHPDLIVSGVNNGYNIGVDTMYSGTVGAAMQAIYHGYSSIALSADYKGFDLVEKELDNLLNHIINNKLYSTDYVLNINFPLDDFINSKGILTTEIAFLNYEVLGKTYNNFFSVEREIIKDEIPKNSDRYAVENGYISITKLTLF